MQHISQDEAVPQLWSYIQLSLCKLSTQRDAIISVLATQLTLCIKAHFVPAPASEEEEGDWCRATGIHPRTAQHPMSTNGPTTSAQVIPYRGELEVRGDRVSQISLWQMHHVDGGQESEGWMRKEKNIQEQLLTSFGLFFAGATPVKPDRKGKKKKGE